MIGVGWWGRGVGWLDGCLMLEFRFHIQLDPYLSLRPLCKIFVPLWLKFISRRAGEVQSLLRGLDDRQKTVDTGFQSFLFHAKYSKEQTCLAGRQGAQRKIEIWYCRLNAGS